MGPSDMALLTFVRKILADELIDVFNQGHHARDFTYIDDIVQAVVCGTDRVAQPNPNWTGDTPDPSTSSAPYRRYNIGNNKPIQLMDFMDAIDNALGRKAKKFCPCGPVAGRWLFAR